MEHTKITDETTDIIKIWKKKKITSATMEFTCGGDSMGDYSFTFYNDGKLLKNNVRDLESYFDNAVFNNVDFYVNSDGHYVGESGTVIIELNEEGDGFYYSKSSMSEYSESFSDIVKIDVEKDEVDFIENFVGNINGGYDGSVINYKKDFILNDNLKKIHDKLVDKIVDYCSDHEIEGASGEASDDWFTYTTRLDDDDSTDNDVKIEENKVHILLNKNYTIYRDN